MAMALESRAKADDILIGDTPKAIKRRRRLKGVQTAGRLWKHSRLADVEGIVTREEMASMFTFTLVRNPWDRVVSYYHWLQTQTFDHPSVKLAQNVDFPTFVSHDHTRQSLRTSPYDSYMRDGAGAEHCNSYIRLEHLKDDLGELEQHLKYKIEMPVENASERIRDWRVYYTETTKAIVAEMCSKDIERFGYSFDC